MSREYAVHDERGSYVFCMTYSLYWWYFTPLQVKVEDFLAAARRRWERGSSRQRALRYMASLLDTRPVGLGLRHLVLTIGQILREGIR